MIFPLAWRNRSSKALILRMTGLTPAPCRSQPSACMSTMMRPAPCGESSIARSASIAPPEMLTCSLSRSGSPRQISVIEILLWRVGNIDLFQKRRDVFLLEPDIQIGRVIIQRFPLDGNIAAEPVPNAQRNRLLLVAVDEIVRFIEGAEEAGCLIGARGGEFPCGGDDRRRNLGQRFSRVQQHS